MGQTKGKWMLHEPSIHTEVETAKGNDIIIVCEDNGDDFENHPWVIATVAGSAGDDFNDQTKSNAELIVSAPDLLKQNKELLEIAENYLVTLNGFEDDNIISNDGRLTLGKVKEAINNAKY